MKLKWWLKPLAHGKKILWYWSWHNYKNINVWIYLQSNSVTLAFPLDCPSYVEWKGKWVHHKLSKMTNGNTIKTINCYTSIFDLFNFYFEWKYKMMNWIFRWTFFISIFTHCFWCSGKVLLFGSERGSIFQVHFSFNFSFCFQEE